MKIEKELDEVYNDSDEEILIPINSIG